MTALQTTGMGEASTTSLGEGATLLRGFAEAQAAELLSELRQVALQAPFRHMVTPGGFRMSVAMTSCGELGWVSDRKGYRYTQQDPASGLPWPLMPPSYLALANAAARESGFARFVPDTCLINQYASATRLSLHQDKDERDFGMPIVSVSLGLPAVFLFGGPSRRDRPRRVRLLHGDVAVWGGPARLAFHGVAPVAAETGSLRRPGPGSGDLGVGIFEKLQDAAGLGRRISFHDLRHVAATLMLIAGVDLKVVSTTLGHASAGFTANVYAHVLESMQRTAAEKMDRLLSANAEPMVVKW